VPRSDEFEPASALAQLIEGTEAVDRTCWRHERRRGASSGPARHPSSRCPSARVMTAALWVRAMVVCVGGAALLVALSWRRRQQHRSDTDAARLGPQRLDHGDGFPPGAATGQECDPIGEQSEQSFPASDAPSWSGVTVGPVRR
jgi:hypothetical protein